MPITVDINGKQTVVSHPETRGLTGRYFSRRDPVDDPSDLVVVLGAINVGSVASGPVAEIVVAAAEFGATVEDWGDSSSTSVDLEDFVALYRELRSPERASLALEKAAESAAQTEALAKDKKRISPWSRS